MKVLQNLPKDCKELAADHAKLMASFRYGQLSTVCTSPFKRLEKSFARCGKVSPEAGCQRAGEAQAVPVSHERISPSHVSVKGLPKFPHSSAGTHRQCWRFHPPKELRAPHSQYPLISLPVAEHVEPWVQKKLGIVRLEVISL